MFSTLLIASSIVAMSAPAAAAPLFFDFAAVNDDLAISFTLDSKPAVEVDPTDPGAFVIRNVLARTRDGLVAVDLTFFDTIDYFGGFRAEACCNYSNARGPQLFSGTYDMPGFAPGTFKLSGFSEGSTDGLLTISAVSGAVPEPATWAMLLAGFGAVGGSMRRRRMTMRFA